MRIIVVVVAITGLVGGLLGAFAYSQMAGEAGAAPQDQRVREQNLDANGLIRVHETGMPNVNVANASLPVSGTVDVGNLPIDAQGNLRVASEPPSAKTYVLFEGTMNPNESLTTNFVDVAGCRDFSIFVLHGGQSTPQALNRVGVSLVVSADGLNNHGTVPPFNEYSSYVGDQVNFAYRFTTGLEIMQTRSPSYLALFTPFGAASLQWPYSVPSPIIKVTMSCVA